MNEEEFTKALDKLLDFMIEKKAIPDQKNAIREKVIAAFKEDSKFDVGNLFAEKNSASKLIDIVVCASLELTSESKKTPKLADTKALVKALCKPESQSEEEVNKNVIKQFGINLKNALNAFKEKLTVNDFKQDENEKSNFDLLNFNFATMFGVGMNGGAYVLQRQDAPYKEFTDTSTGTGPGIAHQDQDRKTNVNPEIEKQLGVSMAAFSGLVGELFKELMNDNIIPKPYTPKTPFSTNFTPGSST